MENTSRLVRARARAKSKKDKKGSCRVRRNPGAKNTGFLSRDQGLGH